MYMQRERHVKKCAVVVEMDGSRISAQPRKKFRSVPARDPISVNPKDSPPFSPFRLPGEACRSNV